VTLLLQLEAVHAQLRERCAELEAENDRLQAQQQAAPGRVRVQARAPRVSGIKVSTVYSA
jgi:hypothetical protein